MGCVISCGLKLVLQILNTVLFIAFIAVAIFGILLKTSKSVVQSLLEKIFNQFNIGQEEIREFAQFVVDNADGIALVLIIVGFALAALCLVGCIASCCGCDILLKIYAVILAILMIAQIIAVAVLFSDPNRLTNLLVEGMEKLLPSYGKPTTEGQTATAVWNVLMTFQDTCCGMDGYTDFTEMKDVLPLQCCNITTTTNPAKTCNAVEAAAKKMPGCREKIVQFTADNMKILMYVAIGAILLQAALILIVGLIICL